MARSNGHGHSRLTYLLAGTLALFVSYHYWPTATVKAGHTLANTTVTFAKAGWSAASKVGEAQAQK